MGHAARALGIAILALHAGVACADGQTNSKKPRPHTADVSLSITVDNGQGRTSHATLRCHDNKSRITGYLTGDRRELCRRARELAPFLSSPSDPHRICAQLYGGPETASIRGIIGRHPIDRHFSRTDQCEINDWNQVADLLAGAL